MTRLVLLMLACALTACGANARYAPRCEWRVDHPSTDLDLGRRADVRHLRAFLTIAAMPRPMHIAELTSTSVVGSGLKSLNIITVRAP